MNVTNFNSVAHLPVFQFPIVRCLGWQGIPRATKQGAGKEVGDPLLLMTQANQGQGKPHVAHATLHLAGCQEQLHVMTGSPAPAADDSLLPVSSSEFPPPAHGFQVQGMVMGWVGGSAEGWRQ